jgi:hypothetical protein
VYWIMLEVVPSVGLDRVGGVTGLAGLSIEAANELGAAIVNTPDWLFPKEHGEILEN